MGLIDGGVAARRPGVAIIAAVVVGDSVVLAWELDGTGGDPGGEAARIEVVGPADVHDRLTEIEATVRPRWLWWSAATAGRLVDDAIHVERCWDLAAVHRIVAGGWHCGPGEVWAVAHGLDPDAVPGPETFDLFHQPDDGDPDDPVRPDGHLRRDWVEGAWADSVERAAHWARLALEVRRRQLALLDGLGPAGLAGHRRANAHAESSAELLGVELAHHGLPIDLDAAERVIGSLIGPRPVDAADETRRTAERDELLLRHAPADVARSTDLRNPGQVKSLLRRVGIEVEDTRAWRLERLVDEHPLVSALLRWRKAERIATTFGYRWLDEHVRPAGPGVGADATATWKPDESTGRRGRLHGRWSASDGAAGRMTATAGLHNLPAELRPAVAAEPGHVLVRADLGQIEPRILAAVSGDRALVAATRDDDMYLPVARRLGVERDVAKVAVLGAMYGQTTGTGAAALRGLERAYPVAMGFLHDAADRAEGGIDLATIGGRRIRMSGGGTVDDEPDRVDDERARMATDRRRAAARGRYGRNAVVQGAAAEFFKAWAALVRNRSRPLGATIVLCLHDELLVHVPATAADEAVRVLVAGLDETAHRWCPPPVRDEIRFVADVSVIARWSDAQ